MTCEDFLGLFETTSDAIEFEHSALSIGDEFLPPEARAVRDHLAAGEPSGDYWSWLCSQVGRDREESDDELGDE